MPTQLLRKKSIQLPEMSILFGPQKNPKHTATFPSPQSLNLEGRFGRFVQQLGFLRLHCIELLLELLRFHFLPSNFHLSAMSRKLERSKLEKNFAAKRLCFIFLLKHQEFLCNRSILLLSDMATWMAMSTCQHVMTVMTTKPLTSKMAVSWRVALSNLASSAIKASCRLAFQEI